ncbi:hypothetical protein ACLB2K_017004 [Fragaria x ananassa]
MLQKYQRVNTKHGKGVECLGGRGRVSGTLERGKGRWELERPGWGAGSLGNCYKLKASVFSFQRTSAVRYQGAIMGYESDDGYGSAESGNDEALNYDDDLELDEDDKVDEYGESRYCWNCVEENHCPVHCETVEKWILKNKDDSQNTQWILVNSKPCPKCKRPIEKNQGCNHMTCSPPCGYQFCWLCLGPNKSYSGCYCNWFRQGSVDNPETSMNTDEKARKKAKMYLERYIHYYERWETNGRSKKKALEDFNKIIDCRQVLRWTYAYGYYLPEDAAAKKHLFECLQGYAEFSLERLHNCAESELQPLLVSSSSAADEDFKKFKTKLLGLTKVTGTYFKRLVTALEEGLPETLQYGAGAAFKVIDWACDQCTSM